MFLKKNLNTQFNQVVTHVKNTSESVGCSGAAVVIIKNDVLVTEQYWGKHSKAANSRNIQEDTQFHVASVRKSYIGYAVAYAIHKGFITSIDDLVADYLPLIDSAVLNNTTIRHLLTHTHGLNSVNGRIQREFKPGENWAYRGIGIDLLTQIVKNTTGQTVSEIVSEQVCQPLSLKETGWYEENNEKLVDVIRRPNDPNWYTSKSTDGDRMNMYVSARELAIWGYLHLKQGCINGKEIVPKEIINMATSNQSPSLLDSELPRNGYLWFIQNLPSKKTELGALVPQGAFQILGYTGVTLLVIPQFDLVAVRAFNSFGSPDGFDYLADVRGFGNTVMNCI